MAKKPSKPKVKPVVKAKPAQGPNYMKGYLLGQAVAAMQKRQRGF